jgi:hypothetical protein
MLIPVVLAQRDEEEGVWWRLYGEHTPVRGRVQLSATVREVNGSGSCPEHCRGI